MSKGKWIKDKSKTGEALGVSLFRCSNCMNIVCIDEDSPLEDISEYKYCFNCGAKMGVEK